MRLTKNKYMIMFAVHVRLSHETKTYLKKLKVQVVRSHIAVYDVENARIVKQEKG